MSSPRVRLSSNTSLRDRSSASSHHATLTPPGSGRSTPFAGGGSYDSSTYGGSGYYGNSTYGQTYASAGGGRGDPHGHRFADDLEGQNDEALDGLSAKVKLLKDITIGIGNEVRESTKQLSHMSDTFTETGGILQGTFRRMNNMASRQGCQWLWYIVFLIVVFWFFIIVWWFRK